MQIKTFEELFKHLLSDTYSAEKQLIRALPKLARAAHAPSLEEAIWKKREDI